MTDKKPKAQYDDVRKEIKDLLYEPYLKNYTRFGFDTLILLALDLIFDRISKEGEDNGR